MYLLLFAVVVAIGILLLRRGNRRGRPGLVWAGGGLIAAIVALYAVLDLWGEMLWFEAVGYGPRFWAFIGYQGTAATVGVALGFVLVWLLSTPARRLQPEISPWTEAAGAVGGGLWGLATWEALLLFVNRASAGIREPMLGLDAGFYLFTLPWLQALDGLLLWVLFVAAAGTAAAMAMGLQRQGFTASATGQPALAEHDRGRLDQAALAPLAVLSLGLGLYMGAGSLLSAFELLYSDAGVAAGPGWTDWHVRLPVYLLLALLAVGLGALPLLRAAREALWRRFGPRLAAVSPLATPLTTVTAGAWGLFALLWVLLAGLLPAAFQGLAVEPNEITFEKPYIANNIRLTRHAYGLDTVEQREYPADQQLTRATIANNGQAIENIRLWDWRALDAVYKQFQEIRLYYEFVDVDVDRYHFGDGYRQVMVSAREMSQDSLPAQSQTFVNRRFKYTHGYGLTLATVSDFTPEGLPNLLVKDIPPVSAYPSLAVTRPEIYYGELTSDAVVVNSEEREFDHPRGEQNVYNRYQGSGGVEMRNLWRKFVFGWKLDGTRLLLSTYPRPQSRFLLHRQIQDRVSTLAPFLTLDDDPYMALVDGRLYWIIDAYTTSERFPYSEPFRPPDGTAPFRARTREAGTPHVDYLSGINYLRNSVKVIIDAYDGTVDFYVFAPKDPIIRAWRSALPGMFKDGSAMPAGLRAHVRYPEGLLLTQGLVYAKYHMRDPEVFYNQEDLWVRATEKHYGRVEPVEPYYVMWQLPGSAEAEFVLMMPFTPKNRQVLIGWIAGLCDGEDYGRFLAYQFPKERRVLGPQQVETKIDQDSYLSGQLTLWDQRGSNVIRGNVLAIPLDETLLYVEPIYLQADTAAYPELRLVAVMHGDRLSYAETFDAAIAGLFEPGAAPMGPAPVPAAGAESARRIGERANQAFERWLKAQGEGRFRDAADALEELQGLLSRFTGSRPAGQPGLGTRRD